MKLASFHTPAGVRPAVVAGDEIVDLAAADPALRRPARRAARTRPGRPAAHARDRGLRRASAAARRRAPGAAGPAAHVLRHRPQLRRPRRGDRSRDARAHDGVHQGQLLRHRAVRPGRATGRVRLPRLRGRAGDRDRPALPPRPRAGCRRGDRGLPDRRRRQRARLADPDAAVVAREVVRHPRADRAVDRHRRRARRPARARHPHLRQRRAAPAVQHPAADLRLLPAGRDPLPGVHAWSRAT